MFNLQQSMIARDSALYLVLKNEPTEWASAYALFIKYYAKHSGDLGWFTGEDVRAGWLRAGYPEPHTPHVYGAMISQAVKSKVIADTGLSRKMKAVGSHARRTPVWRKGPAA